MNRHMFPDTFTKEYYYKKASKLTDDELFCEYMKMTWCPEEVSFGRAAHINTEIKKREKRLKEVNNALNILKTVENEQTNKK